MDSHYAQLMRWNIDGSLTAERTAQMIADPHFANVAGDDFKLTAESESALAGFKPFDLSKVGPR